MKAVIREIGEAMEGSKEFRVKLEEITESIRGVIIVRWRSGRVS
jgi:hypothetical protein